MQFKQLQINPKTFRDFNGIQTHGLCVSTAVLYHLSYEDPYMPVHWKQAKEDKRDREGIPHTHAIP